MTPVSEYLGLARRALEGSENALLDHDRARLKAEYYYWLRRAFCEAEGNNQNRNGGDTQAAPTFKRTRWNDKKAPR